jgi:hypothetical protein
VDGLSKEEVDPEQAEDRHLEEETTTKITMAREIGHPEG